MNCSAIDHIHIIFRLSKFFRHTEIVILVQYALQHGHLYYKLSKKILKRNKKKKYDTAERIFHQFEERLLVEWK